MTVHKIISCLAIAVFLLSPSFCFAAPGAGITSGSPFYFIDIFFEKVDVFFTFNPAKKIQKYLSHAEERIAELKALALKKELSKPNEIRVATENYKNNIASAVKNIKDIKQEEETKKILKIISENLASNQTALSEMYDNAPNEVGEILKESISSDVEIQDQIAKQTEESRSEAEILIEQLQNEMGILKEEIKGKASKTQKLKESDSGDTEKLKEKIKVLEEQTKYQALKVSGSSKIDYSTFIPYVVQIVCSDGKGSGTIVSPNTILTNYHVIEGNAECLIGLTTNATKAPSEWIVGKITGINSSLDRALIQINSPLANKTIRKCNATDTKIADNLIIIGYPSAGGDTITITNGNISGFVDYYIKTSAKINPGNSGGAAIHESGCYLGIPTAYIKGEAESLGLIIDERIGGAVNDNDASISPVDETYQQEIGKKRQEELLRQQEQERLEAERRAREQAILEAQRREQERQEAERRLEQEKTNQVNALVSEFQQKAAQIDTQIADLRVEYYNKPSDIRERFKATDATESSIQREITVQQNRIATQINLLIAQREQLRQEYLNKINGL